MASSIADALADAGLTATPTPPKAAVAVSSDTSQIGVDQIAPGIVVLDLDPIILLEDKRVRYTGTPVKRSGPFLCVDVDDDGVTTWAGLTRKYRLERMEIEAGWRAGGGSRWRQQRQFLTDGANLWRGPKDAFAAASWRETFNDVDDLPRLTAVGLAAVRRKIDAAAERRPAEWGGSAGVVVS
jgi:hypothetical protein